MLDGAKEAIDAIRKWIPVIAVCLITISIIGVIKFLTGRK